MNPDAHTLWRAPRWSLAMLLACLGMLGPFSIDTYLPAFAGIAQSIGASAVEMQQTLSAYLFAFAFMNLFHGALSDSFGRRPVVLTGIAVFTLASVGCALSTSIGALVAFRALQGIGGTTVVHLCFGYAAAVKDKPTGYSFLPQLADTTAAQISIEAAQPRLDLSVLKQLSKTIMVGVIDLGTPQVETPQEVASRIRAALKHVPAERLVLAPDCGMKYLTREAAFGKLKALAEGAAMVRKQLA